MKHRPSLIGIAILILGFSLLLTNGWALAQYSSNRNWPSTTGTITKNDYVFIPSEERVVRWSGRRTQIDTPEEYHITINYEYEVDGQSYMGDRIALYGTNVRTKQSTVDQLMVTYPEGGSVSVYYDPDNPETAVLETGGDPEYGRRGLPMLIGLILIFTVGRLIFSNNPMMRSFLLRAQKD